MSKIATGPRGYRILAVTMATHLLVANPTAQSGKNKARIDRVLALLAAAGIDAELLPTLPGGATIGAVRDALDARSYDVVIAMGGDGTFREVGAGLHASRARERVALAMMPTGTANDQGKSFGLEATPEALERNVEVIRAGHETRLDVGLIRSGDGPVACFFDSAGWGLSARVLAQRNKDRALVETLGPLKQLYRDHAVYAGAFLKTFLESYVVDDKLSADAVVDGKRIELAGLTDLVAKNTRVYAGAWVLDRSSRHDDGAFELVPFRGKRDWASKAIVDLDGNPVTEGMLNEVGIEHSKPIRFSTLELVLSDPPGGAPLAAQIDGEEWPASSRVRIDVEARALRLVVPAGAV
jgi:diacylglycerol kinase family enzyme